MTPCAADSRRPGACTRVAYLQLAAAIVLFGLTCPDHQDRPARPARRSGWRPARASLSALTAFVLLAALGRLRWPHRADWPIVLSVGVFQLTLLLRLRQSRRAERAAGPLGRAGLHRHAVDGAAVAAGRREASAGAPSPGVVLGLAGIVVLIDPQRFDWSDRAVVEGHGWLLLAGFSWALAILHARRHRWRGCAARRAALADVGGDRPAVDRSPSSSSPRAISTSARPTSGSRCSISAPSPARPAPGPPSRSPAPCRRSPARSACWARRCSASPRRSSWWASRSPGSLLLGTALMIAGIAIVILDRRSSDS